MKKSALFVVVCVVLVAAFATGCHRAVVPIQEGENAVPTVPTAPPAPTDPTIPPVPTDPPIPEVQKGELVISGSIFDEPEVKAEKALSDPTVAAIKYRLRQEVTYLLLSLKAIEPPQASENPVYIPVDPDGYYEQRVSDLAPGIYTAYLDAYNENSMCFADSQVVTIVGGQTISASFILEQSLYTFGFTVRDIPGTYVSENEYGPAVGVSIKFDGLDYPGHGGSMIANGKTDVYVYVGLPLSFDGGDITITDSLGQTFTTKIVFNWFEHREAGNYLIFWWSGLGELELEAYIPEPEVPMITLTDADTGCDIVIDDGGWYYNNYQVLFPQASAEDVLGHLLVEYYDANGYFNYALVAVNSGFPLYLHLPVRPTSIRLSYVLDSGNTYLVDPKQWICLVDGSTQVENFDDWWYNSI